MNNVYKKWNQRHQSDLDTSNWVTVWLQYALQLKIHGDHLSCKTIKNVFEQVEVVGRSKDVLPINSLPVNR